MDEFEGRLVARNLRKVEARVSVAICLSGGFAQLSSFRLEREGAQNRHGSECRCDRCAAIRSRGAVTDSKPDLFIRTLRLKVKAESYRWLEAAAVEVNQVWNWANATSMDAADRCRRAQPRYLSAFDLNNLSAGGVRVLRAHRCGYDSARQRGVCGQAPGGEAGAAALAGERRSTAIPGMGAVQGGKS